MDEEGGPDFAHGVPKFYRSSLPVSPPNASHFIHARLENATSHHQDRSNTARRPGATGRIAGDGILARPAYRSEG